MFRVKFISYFCMPILLGLLLTGCGKSEETNETKAVIEKYESAMKSSEQVEDNLVVLVDNFDNGKKPNALGGDFGAWNSNPKDPTQGCTDSFDSQNARGGLGYCLRLDYDVDSPNPAYNGFWTNLMNSDLTSANQLVFYVKGSETEGFTTQFKIELKNAKGEVGSYIVTGITGVWQRVIIPLSKFVTIKDWKDMRELVIVFDDINVTKKVGTIFVDDIYFSAKR